MRQFILYLSILFCGCQAPTTLELNPKFRPIEKIVQTPNDPFLTSDSVITTKLNECYVRNLGAFLSDTPEGSPEFEAVLLHEKSHALRHLELGFDNFQKYYNTDLHFRWAEESAGWKIQIECLLSKGVKIDEVWIANFLANNPAYHSMVEYTYALEWVGQIVRNYSKPK